MKIGYKRTLLYSAIVSSALLAILALLLPGARLLIAFFVYTATLNSGFIPFPTMTAAIFLGKSYSPFLVAAVGTSGSAVSSIVIYYLVTKLSKRERMRRIENSRLIKSWKALARRSTFLSLVVFNTIPLPIEPSRFLAIFNRYSITRYVMAISLGRFVRYFLLAAVGETFRIPNGVLIALTVVLIAVPLLAKKRNKHLNHRTEIAGSRCIRRDT
jgi:uncharacterized membrane protein YdjX (TVP38/TMEM64 family)